MMNNIYLNIAKFLQLQVQAHTVQYIMKLFQYSVIYLYSGRQLRLSSVNQFSLKICNPLNFKSLTATVTVHSEQTPRCIYGEEINWKSICIFSRSTSWMAKRIFSAKLARRQSWLMTCLVYVSNTRYGSHGDLLRGGGN